MPRLLTQAVVLPAVLSAVVALVLVGEVRALVSLSRWVQHTDRVIAQAQQVYRLLADRESGLRGFLLTGRTPFLDPYTRSNPPLQASFTALGDLVADNPQQRDSALQMRQLSDEWESFAAQTLRLQAAGDEAALLELLQTGAGQRRMEALRSGLDDFVKVEEQLRDERTRREQVGATRIIGGSVVLLLLLGLLLGLMARRQLRTVARGYGQALSTAEQTMELREEFLTVAAHELRTPLTSLQLQLQRIRREMERERQPSGFSEHLATALRQTRRLWSLIEALLDAYTLSAGTAVELTLEDLDLAELARGTVARMDGELKHAGCEVTVEGGPALGRWDRARVERIAATLLRNACKYGEGKPIQVRIQDRVAEMTLSVTDQGIGIPAERLQSIFGRFGRAVPATSYGGFGLSLFVARSLAEAHGGRLEVVSEQGKGSTFVLRLPPRPAVRQLQAAG